MNKETTPQQADNKTLPPKPFMWERNDPQLIQNFMDIKLPELNKIIPNQPYAFLLENFFGMIRYFENTYSDDYKCLHVYIAAYSDKGSNVPIGCGNKLTLIFAPAKSYQANTDIAYFNIPTGVPFDETKPGNFIVDNEPLDWRSNYKKFLDALEKTIDKTDQDNKNGDGSISDTKCITFCRPNFTELANEQILPHNDINPPNDPIILSNNILASFAAFKPIGSSRKPVGKYKKRLFVQFDFIENNKKVRFLENTDGFDTRTDSDENKQCGDCGPFPLNDNGKLCPPHCP